MVESIGKNVNIKLKNSNVQLNKNTVKGTSIDKDTPIFMKKYDSNGDGVISQKEADKMLKDLKKAAGNNTLSDKEFEKAKLGTKEDYNKIAPAVTKKAGNKTVKNKDGSTTTTTRNEDGTITKITTNGKNKLTSNYDANGNIVSQQKTTPEGSSATSYKYDENGNLINQNTVTKNSKGQIKGQSRTVNTYDEAGNRIGMKCQTLDSKGKLVDTSESKFEYDADGNNIKSTNVVTDAKGNKIRSGVQTFEYNKDGKLAKSLLTETTKDSTVTTNKTYAANGETVLHASQDVKNKDGSTAHTEQQNNEFGKMTEKHTVKKDKNGNVLSDLKTNAEYGKDGKTVKTINTEGTTNGKPFNEILKYDENGKLSSIDKSLYKLGGKIEEHYEGPNLENRKGYIPSKSITYEEDGKTIKEVTINKFDKDGVLIGSEIQDKNGKVIDTHDFSRIDGNFDTSYQKGRGDCYLLAGMNALRGSEGGREALKKTITTGKDPKTGETTYTVHFPGAAKIRQDLINQGVPEDQIDIKDSYTYTESQIHEKAKLAGKKYSAGDKDVLLLEVGYEDLRTDARADINDLRKANPKLTNRQIEQQLHVQGLTSHTDGDNLSSGQESDAIFMITGKTCEKYSVRNSATNSDAPVCSIDADLNMKVNGNGFNVSAQDSAKIDSMFDKIEQDGKDGKLDNYSGTVSFLISSQTVNGKVVKGGGHAFTISRVEGDNVYLRNPWDPTKEIVMTRDEVKKAATTVAVADFGTGETSTVTGGGTHGQGGVAQLTGGNLGQGGAGQVTGGNQGGGSTNPVDGNNTNPNTPQAGSNFKVPEGKGYRTLISEALKAQGIDPTPENIEKASKQFKAANKGAVKIYNGPNTRYRGNEYLLMGTVVKIPKFEF